jgi:hypothetical protein
MFMSTQANQNELAQWYIREVWDRRNDRVGAWIASSTAGRKDTSFSLASVMELAQALGTILELLHHNFPAGMWLPRPV